MKSHTQIYLSYFDLGLQDIITCEGCLRPGRVDGEGFDLHHIWGRGKGKDVIQNLMLLCRKCHEKAHSTLSKSELQLIHNYFMQGTRKIFIK